MTLSLLLAIACTLEIDLGVRAEQAERYECGLQWAIFATASENTHTPLAEVVRHYVSGFVCERHSCDSDRMKMIRSMNEEGTQPIGWPIKAGPWNSFKDRWLTRLEDAHDFSASLDERVTWPATANPACRRARHFGGACGAHGACDQVPVCWELAPCGTTANAYWVPHKCKQAGVIDARVASASRHPVR